VSQAREPFEYEYRFVETGVGCAAHNDPTCLCDVIVSAPSEIADGYLLTESVSLRPDENLMSWLGRRAALAEIQWIGTKADYDRDSLVWSYAGIRFGEAAPQYLLDVMDTTVVSTDVAKRWGIPDGTVRSQRKLLGLVALNGPGPQASHRKRAVKRHRRAIVAA
jgi:hypothetical protein